jgi:Holliday junction DNA helicase RuvA
MIGYLSGNVIGQYEDKIILDVNGVGYEIYVPVRSLDELTVGKQFSLFIFSEVKEDAIDFYGFITDEEKLFFKRIRSVHGVGPKTALSIMSLDIATLERAIVEEDLDVLTSLHGLGKKGAERLILELKNTIANSASYDRKHQSVHREVFDALTNLGYKQKDVARVMRDLPHEINKTEDIIKYFLKSV